MSYRSSNWMGNKTDKQTEESCPVQVTPQTPAQPPLTPGQPPAQVTPAPDMFTREGPPPVMDIEYIPGYLRSIIGKNVRAEFIIGSNQYTDRTGVLIDVGVNYFVLHDVNSRTHIMCDLYSVKFVTVIL